MLKSLSSSRPQSSLTPIMQSSDVLSLPRVLLQVQRRFRTVMDSLNSDPKMAEFMDTSLGKYLNGHPFLTLSLLVFGAMATIPVGLFLVFAMATFITATMGFMLLEVFLLFLGGATLLCVLCGVAMVAVVVSSILSAIYVMTSNMLNLYYSQWLSEEKRGPAKTLGVKEPEGVPQRAPVPQHPYPVS